MVESVLYRIEVWSVGVWGVLCGGLGSWLLGFEVLIGLGYGVLGEVGGGYLRGSELGGHVLEIPGLGFVAQGQTMGYNPCINSQLASHNQF